MKTLFVCSVARVNFHVGEEYDDILEVEHQPTTATIRDWADRLRGRIRKLWMEQSEADPDRGVSVSLDAASPFNNILINLQILMESEEGIRIELPYREGSEHVTSDPEARELMAKLDGQNHPQEDKSDAEV